MFLNIHLIKHRYFVCIYNELNIAHYIFKLLTIDKINLNLITCMFYFNFIGIFWFEYTLKIDYFRVIEA